MNRTPAPISALARICLPHGLPRDQQDRRAAEIIPLLAAAQVIHGEDIAPWMLSQIPGEGASPAQMLRGGEDERLALILERAA